MILKVTSNIIGNMNTIEGNDGAPQNMEFDVGEGKFCKIPLVENGYVFDKNFDNIYQPFEDVDEIVVEVKCDRGYELEILEHQQSRTCMTTGWDGDFPKCQSYI